MGESQDTLALDLWRKYSVPSPSEEAAKYRNPYLDVLIDYAKCAGAELQRILDATDAEIVIGGSLGYGAAIRGSYDIDLRILFPSAPDAMSRMKKASATLRGKAGFGNEDTFGEERNIFYQDKCVKIDGLPDDAVVSLEVNIQLKSGYFGMAGLASQLPEIVIDRLVAAKGQSKQAGSDEYKRVKKHWQEFLIWLDANGFRKATQKEREELLTKAEPLYPLFFRNGE